MATNGNKLLNYTTEVAPEKTIGEIIGLLATKGAQSIQMDYVDGKVSAVKFQIQVQGTAVAFRLPSNTDGAFKAFVRLKVPSRYNNKPQAERVAWRIVKTWVEAQMALIDLGQAEIAEVFLPYAITSTGQTLFQRIQENPARLLGAAE